MNIFDKIKSEMAMMTCPGAMVSFFSGVLITFAIMYLFARSGP